MVLQGGGKPGGINPRPYYIRVLQIRLYIAL